MNAASTPCPSRLAGRCSRVALAAVLLLAVAADSRAKVLCGDVNDNGNVTSSDALAVLRGAVGLDVNLVCEPGAKPAVTGQTTSFGSGSDGDVQAGLPRVLVDNGDGTVTDSQSGLMWEKKDFSDGIHRVDDVYAWSATPGTMDGSMVTEFLSVMNKENGFAGHNDWRIPNIMELMTLVDFDAPHKNGTMIADVFDSACAPGCAQGACSCTAAAPYWTSSTDLNATTKGGQAWIIDFGTGQAYAGSKASTYAVRAVRGGL